MEQVLTLEEMTKAAYEFSGLVMKLPDFPKWEDLTEQEKTRYYMNVHESFAPEEHPSEVPYLLPFGFKDKKFHMSIQLHTKF